ncbi:heme peroxidase superfamily protein [Thecamonas trahens ATCC 50062]|uniref:Heme peroxidase superfamily protein n=1 Tax=Thecamonas trahens ATCC 50062 TaxID=461836 RepID=A0A0L0DGR2_THETB|nr:heme peroxidase superfamily protein [Thecamonas trahens ATCC 50062]KNC51380.1 heme peroxidase superfamily protein [Thecamonas trahens ATCC 50062]|eukprot:XP_013756048.1 heme peroxidase superfamily protein [Thecamonas trahens ATCC 50062]
MTTPSSPYLRSLSEFFFNPKELAGRGVDAFMHGMLLYPSQEVDAQYAKTLIDFPHLLALDCMRVRDLGLASFEHARAHYGIASPVTDVPRKLALLDVYASSSEGTDLFTGGLAEEHEVGSSFGPVFNAIYAQQLLALRDGDPYWFENPSYALLSAAERTAARATTLAHIIRRNTDIPADLVPDNAFKMPFYSANTASSGGVATSTSSASGSTSSPASQSTADGHVYPTAPAASNNAELRYLRALTGITVVGFLVVLASAAVLAATAYRLVNRPTAAPVASTKRSSGLARSVKPPRKDANRFDGGASLIHLGYTVSPEHSASYEGDVWMSHVSSDDLSSSPRAPAAAAAAAKPRA